MWSRPFSVAIESAVLPKPSTTSLLQPAATSAFATSSLPFWQAIISGVCPCRFACPFAWSIDTARWGKGGGSQCQELVVLVVECCPASGRKPMGIKGSGCSVAGGGYGGLCVRGGSCM